MLDEDSAALKAEFTDIVNSFLQNLSFQIPNSQHLDFNTIQEGVLHYLRRENLALDFAEQHRSALKDSVI